VRSLPLSLFDLEVQVYNSIIKFVCEWKHTLYVVEKGMEDGKVHKLIFTLVTSQSKFTVVTSFKV